MERVQSVFDRRGVSTVDLILSRSCFSLDACQGSRYQEIRSSCNEGKKYFFYMKHVIINAATPRMMQYERLQLQASCFLFL